MFFKQFLREDLGCASYLIGDADAAECAIVDPQWNITEYIDTAAKQGLKIRYVVETHNHADHVSGHGKLAEQGAEVCIHESANVAYPHRALKEGDTITVGGVRLQVLHTPGHRPEHIALVVTDTTRADAPWLVLTGDALFVGDVGRPDLAVEPREGAAELYKSLKSKLLKLDDMVEVYPSHISGSLCGKALSAKGSSTVGFERRYNPPLSAEGEQGFIDRVTGELPPQPPHFGRIVEKNRGPFLTEELEVRAMSADEVEALRRKGGMVLDARSPGAFGGGHIPGAINVDLHDGQFGNRAAWVIPQGLPVVLVVDTPGDVDTAVATLTAVGQETIEGYLLGGMHSWDTGGRPLQTIPQWSAAQLRERVAAGDRSFTVLDVREKSEWKEGHVSGAIHIPFHQLAKRLDEVPSHKPVVTICGGGVRSSIAASILQAEGFEPTNILGGMGAWNASGYPLEAGDETTMATPSGSSLRS
ncbi:MAG: MBL fold metallo-hydrolase [Chloroflexi bacterium]|nr:MBL fold metallo-hydrolase [Chloroflexota bacterium]